VYCFIVSLVIFTGWWEWQEKEGLPTVEEILACMKKDPKELADEEQAVLLWFYFHFLPAAVGKDNWNREIFVEHRFTDTHDKKTNDPTYAMKGCMYLTPVMHAYALWMIENYSEQWINIFKFHEENPKQRVPQKDEKYKCAPYTCRDGGSIQFGGWTTTGLDRFNAIKEEMTKFFESETVKSGAFPQFIKELCAETVKRNTEKDGGGKQSSNAHKRKRPTASEPEDDGSLSSVDAGLN